MDTLSNRTLKGYEIHESIGQGAFGAIYRAYQPIIDREVAIKVILPQYANQPDFIRRFETEAQLIARLEHLHIVPLYDYWRDPDGAYLVMRYLRGGSLKDWIGNGALDPGETLRLVEQIAQALAVAHRHGVVHRDIKPSNILLDEERNAYLADFGIAKVAGGEPSVEGLRGTLDYISPEQIRSQPVTAQTDVYALGIVLYEMLTGTQPFSPSSTPAELLHKHLETPVPEIQTKRDGLPDVVNDVIQTATAKTPAERYADAPQLARALREALAAAELAPAAVEQPLMEPLTDRELDVLRLMAEGLSHGEIAQKLVLAVTTVKWYAQEIYGKLGVSNRRQAVAVGQRLGLLEGAAERRDIALPDWMVGHNPYKGLAAFQQADAPDFFGRQALVEQLAARFQDHDDLARFLAVVGPSGSGKSSVVRAGLLPALKQGSVIGSENWFVVDMLPGAYPLDKLEVTLMRVAVNPQPSLIEQIQRDARGLSRAAELILPEDGQLLLVIDQFEELFTLVEDPAVTRHVLDLIYAAVTEPRSPVRVVITLRADFYDRPLMYPDFFDLMRHRTEVVGPLTPEELEQAIVKPAEMAGVTVEPGLVAALVAEVHEQPGTLPLLEYALTELFERRQGRTMTLAAYQTIGGALGVLTRQADEVYDDLSDAEQDTARQGFLRLVTLGEGTEDVRRRVLLSELSAIGTPQNGMEEVLDLFGEYRLLTFDRDPATREPTVEVAHEALIQRWERLREWIDTNRADIRQQRLLAAAAVEWEKAAHDSSYLLSGSRLAQFEDWAKQANVALTPGEQVFLAASLTEHRQQQTRRQRFRNAVLATAISVVLIMAVLTLVAFGQRAAARDQRDRAEREAAVNHSLVLANGAQAESDSGRTELGLLLALEAVNMPDPPAEAEQALRNVALGPGTRAVLRGHTGPVQTVAFSPDGHLAISGACGQRDGDACRAGELILWDLQTDTLWHRLAGHADIVTSALFTPDGQHVWSASRDGTLILWDANPDSPSFGTALQTLAPGAGAINAIALTPEGSQVLAGTDDASLVLLDAETGDIIRRFEGHEARVNTVAISPDGQMALSGSDDTAVILWDINTGESVRRFEGHTSSVLQVAFSPLGSTVMSASADFTFRQWDMNTGAELHNLRSATVITSFSISPDGSTALVDYGGGALVVVDIASWQITHYLLNNPEGTPLNQDFTVHSVHYDPTGNFGLAGLATGDVIFWNLGVKRDIHRFKVDSVADGFMALALSPDGRRMLAGTIDTGEALLLDIDTTSPNYGTVLAHLPGFPGSVFPVVFSPDGRYALIGSGDWSGSTDAKSLMLWDVDEASPSFAKPVLTLEGYTYYPRSTAFTPDGNKILVSAQNLDGDGELIMWDAATGTVLHHFDTDQSISSILITPDGKRALTTRNNVNDLVEWNIDPQSPDFGKGIRQITTRWITYDLAWGPQGTTFFVGEGDLGLAEYNYETGAFIRKFSGMGTTGWSVDVSRDGRYVIAGDEPGRIFVWDYKTGNQLWHSGQQESIVPFVFFSPDSQSAYSLALTGVPVQWQIGEPTLDELLAWIPANRYIRDFTCDERAQYRIEPLCP